MDTEERKQLVHARELIQQKRYAEAHRILQAMPFSDTAQKWLGKLNQIVPQKPSLPELKPRNISFIYGARFVLFFGMAISLPATIFLAFNWKRLGKPEWVIETILVTVLLIIGIVLSFSLAIGGIVGADIGALAVVGFSFSISALALVLVDLQNAAYTTWKIGGTQALLNHHYDFPSKILQAGGMVALIVAAVGAGLLYASTSKSFENDFVKLEYARNLKEFDANFADYCKQDPTSGCFLTLAITSYSSYTATMFVFSARPAENPQADVDTLVQRFEGNPGIVVNAFSPLTVSDRPGLIVDITTLTPDANEPDVYQTLIVIPTETHVIELNSWTQDTETHAGRRDVVLELAEKMVIK